MSPIPRETTCREVRVHQWVLSSSDAFMSSNTHRSVRALLVTHVPPALALDTETCRHPEHLHGSEAQLLHGCFLQARSFPRALTGVTSHRELSGVGSRSVSERPSVMTMATRLSEVNLRTKFSLVNCKASPVKVPPAIHFRFLTALQK